MFIVSVYVRVHVEAVNHLRGVAACVHLGSVNGCNSLCAFVQCE